MNANPKSTNSAAAMILAAGGGSRMRSIKQLLPYGGGTLLTHAIQQAQLADFDRIIVVIGAHAAEVRSALRDLPVEVAENEDWETGMGSSIFAGLQQLETAGPKTSLLAILLADQPHITAEHLRRMRRAAASAQTPVTAASYNGVLGVPAFFRPEVFPLLASLGGDAGARSLFRGGEVEVTPFPLPEAAVDVDTPEDFEAAAAKPGQLDDSRFDS
jgi:molybdenum cofactor cytidylyltransferase